MIRSIFTTRDSFRSTHMNVLPIFQQSNKIYQFQCCYNATCIGQTSKRLQTYNISTYNRVNEQTLFHKVTQ